MAVYLLQTRKYGFLFEDDEEAAVFSSKVASQFSTGGSECSNLPLPIYIFDSEARNAKEIKEPEKHRHKIKISSSFNIHDIFSSAKLVSTRFSCWREQKGRRLRGIQRSRRSMEKHVVGSAKLRRQRS